MRKAFLLFALIFLVYFCSAAGLFNSGDGPQYFTTEALIQYQSIDLSPLQESPHFFVYPDVATVDNKMVGIRGYMNSIVAIPLHFLAMLVSPVFTDSGFEAHIRHSSFAYELAITALYSIFTIIGLIFMWKTMFEITKSEKIAGSITVALGVGTYFWKYAVVYARQPVMIAILGITMYGYHTLLKKPKPWKWCLIVSMWGISFGIDTVLFIGMTVSFAFLLNTFMRIKKKSHYLAASVPGILIILLNIIGNVTWYDGFTYSLYTQYEFLSEFSSAEIRSIFLSTPLIPTVWYVLFSQGRLPEGIFTNIEEYPQVAAFTSVQYAKVYIFYGLFSISPFFWPILLSLKSLWLSKNRTFYAICSTLFAIGIILNTKWFGFFGPNQYDVRYFYAFLICLGPLLATSIQNMQKRGWLTVFLNSVFAVSVFWSVYMAWLGQLGMYLPAQTGERRIWIYPHDSLEVLSQYSAKELWHLTFMNWANVWAGLLLIIVGFLATSFFQVFWQRSRD